MLNCQILFVSSFYDKPVAGLCKTEDGELLAFEVRHDFEIGKDYYEGSRLSEPIKERLIANKKLFEAHVGFHQSHDVNSREIHPKEEWDKFYSKKDIIEFEWISVGEINLFSNPR